MPTSPLRTSQFLRSNFGSFADYLFRAARGIDLRPVRANRIRKSVGGERTFNEDISSGAALRETLERIVDIVWERIENAKAEGRTVTLKMKFNDFTQVTRARSLPRNVTDKDEFRSIGRALLEEMLPLPMPIRLMGLTLSNLAGSNADGSGEKAAGPGRDIAQLSLL